MQINGQDIKYNNSASKYAILSLKFLSPNYQLKEKLLCVGDKVSTKKNSNKHFFCLFWKKSTSKKKFGFFFKARKQLNVVISKESIRLTDSEALMPVDVTLLVEGLQVPTMIDMNP